ncbi:MAG: hypothetical protein ABW184_09790 [Sphingobium sp.]
MSNGLSDQPIVRVIEALNAIYRTFEMRPPPVIEGCPCCIDTRGTDVLLTTPLRQISGRVLWRYVTGAFLTVGEQRDFKYLLPRILEVSVFDPGNANNPEIVLGKLSLAKWRSWPANEQLVIEEFIGAWFEQALASDLAEADKGSTGWDAESVLCNAGRAGLPLDRWLLRLTEPDAAPVFADMQERFPTKPLGFWEDAPTAFYEVQAFFGRRRA